MFIFDISDVVILALGAIGILMLLGLLVANGIKSLINKVKQKVKQTERSE